jgi:hypothetical protein
LRATWNDDQKDHTKALELRLNQIQERLNRLTDAYIDQAIERELFEKRKSSLLLEQKGIEEKIAQMKEGGQSVPDRLAKFLELAESAYLQYELGLPEEKRELLEIVTSNRLIQGKRVDFMLSFPFNEVANRFKNSYGAPQRDIPRTWDKLLPQLTNYFQQNPSPAQGTSLDSPI